MSPRKWYWDFDYFKRRDEEVAYWAGLLMADGNIRKVSKRSWTLVLALDAADGNHIVSFCNSVGLPTDAIYIQQESGGEIDGREIHGSSAYRVHLNGQELGEDLLFWGIIPRKSYAFIEPMVSAYPELIPHYLRGWADGDGHIYRYGRSARFTVSGHHEALEWYGWALEQIGYTGNYSFQERSEITSILYVGGKNQVRDICDLLQVGSSFCLERKWNSSRDDNRELIPVECEWCGKSFGVPKFRYEHETNGRFCSKECFNNYQRKPIISGQKQCSMCEQWIDLEDFGSHSSYCKDCYREWRREYTKRRKE